MSAATAPRASGRAGVLRCLRGTPSRGMFVFFSNRLGCMGSMAVSAVVTVLLLLAFGVLD